MNPHAFLRQLHPASIEAAIEKAERRTSGDIRVFISHLECADPLAAAKRQFAVLGMADTRLRNAVLIFVAPASQTFAILGDTAAHEKCGEPFWHQLREEMAAHFKSRHYLQAVLHGITRTADTLATHFPPDAIARHELPNSVAHD